MKKVTTLFGLVAMCVMLAASLTACAASDGAEACKSSEVGSGSVCFHDMSIAEMHAQAANAGGDVELINFVPTREFQEATSLDSTDDMLGTAQMISGLAPSGWKISAVSGALPIRGAESTPLRTVTFNRVLPTDNP